MVAMQQMNDQTELIERPGEAPHGWVRHVPAVSTEAGANTLHLHLLGAPQVSVAGRPIVLRTRKTLALLTYLTVQRGQLPREQLADLFWPEADIEDARASLRTTLSYVRQALGSEADAYLTTTRESVGLRASAPLDLDVQALAQARLLLRQAPDLAILRRRIESVVEQYRGPFLEGMVLPDAPDFESWMEGQRTHWRGVQAELLDRLATLQLQEGDPGAALTTLERWTTLDHDEDSPWQRLIDLHLQNGDSAGARRAWKGYCEAMAELDAEPSPAMAALGERVEGEASSQLATSAMPSTKSGVLDFRALPFVGRSQEWASLLAAFERSLRGRTEVAVLEGTAGMGKTRLVSQFLLAAKQRGADVITGRGFETVGELPYAAMVDALRVRLDEENAPEDLLGDLWLAELARLVPELRERYPDLPMLVNDPTLGPGRLFEAVVRLGQALAQRKPLVVWLDDVQWTDGATRDLVRYAVRRWSEGGTPALIILTVRSEDLRADRELMQWLGGLERDVPPLWLALSPLERAEVVQLVGHLAGYSLGAVPSGGTQAEGMMEFGTWLAGQTGGHPLSLAQLICRLLEQQILQVRPTRDGELTIEVPDVRHAERSEQAVTARLSVRPSLAAERTYRPNDVHLHDFPYWLPREAGYAGAGRGQQTYRHGGPAVPE